MIARTWRTGIDLERAQDYEDFARTISLPMFEKQAGFRGVLMLRDGSDCQVITLWRDMADIDALDSSPSYRDTVAQIVAAGFLRGPQSVDIAHLHLCEVLAA